MRFFNRDPVLTESVRLELAKVIEADPSKRTVFDSSKCSHCGGIHMHACPRVKRLTFKQSGEGIAEVEFWPDGQWSRANIIWPWDVFTTPPLAPPEQPPVPELTSAPS